MRRSENLRVLERCFRAGKERFGMRLVHYSVQSNHVHLIVEAVDRRALMRGMRGLTIRCARQLNKAWGTRGPVFGARYTARILHALADVRNTLAYVLPEREAARKPVRHHGEAVLGPVLLGSVVPWVGVPDPSERAQGGATRRGAALVGSAVGVAPTLRQALSD